MMHDIYQFFKLFKLGLLRFRSEEDYRKMQSFVAQTTVGEIEQRGIRLENRNILELGAGKGGYSEILHQKSDNFLASDFEETDYFKDKHIPFLKIELSKPFPIEDDSFDFIYCSSVIEHLENPLSMLEESMRILKRQGCMLLSFPPFYSLSLIGGHMFKPFHFFGEQWAIKLTNFFKRSNFKDYATSFGAYGLYPLTIKQVEIMALRSKFDVLDIYTRNFSLNTTKLPGILKDLMTWHACYLLRKP